VLNTSNDVREQINTVIGSWFFSADFLFNFIHFFTIINWFDITDSVGLDMWWLTDSVDLDGVDLHLHVYAMIYVKSIAFVFLLLYRQTSSVSFIWNDVPAY
ncbi:hypothetical protein ACJX0J_038433, partial [Zea mays]